jgi:hypothetical protein
VFSTLQVYLGSQYVKDFNYLGRTSKVVTQAVSGLGNKRETVGSVKGEETELSACSNGSPTPAARGMVRTTAILELH